MMQFKKLIPLAILGASVTTSQAVVTFVSIAADLGNLSDGGAAVTVNTVENTTDGIWRQRDTFGENDITVLEGWDNGPGGGAEDVPTLTMTLASLTPGVTYDVYINYVRFSAGADPDGTRGSIRGSLDNVNFQSFDGAGGTAGTVGFSELTGHTEADRAGLRGYLGTAVANGSGEIQVFADDGLNNEFSERIWFDGASYEQIPEPSTALLGFFGALGLLRRRR